MRRRALLAASAAGGGGGGEFYCRCVQYHTRTGAVLLDETFTFIVDKDVTWQDCNGLYDIANSANINIKTLPNGKSIIGVTFDKTDYAPTENIVASEKVEFGRTYQFEYKL